MAVPSRFTLIHCTDVSPRPSIRATNKAGRFDAFFTVVVGGAF